VYANSSAAKDGLEEYFDLIVAINGKRFVKKDLRVIYGYILIL